MSANPVTYTAKDQRGGSVEVSYLGSCTLHTPLDKGHLVALTSDTGGRVRKVLCEDAGSANLIAHWARLSATHQSSGQADHLAAQLEAERKKVEELNALLDKRTQALKALQTSMDTIRDSARGASDTSSAILVALQDELQTLAMRNATLTAERDMLTDHNKALSAHVAVVEKDLAECKTELLLAHAISDHETTNKNIVRLLTQIRPAIETYVNVSKADFHFMQTSLRFAVNVMNSVGDYAQRNYPNKVDSHGGVAIPGVVPTDIVVAKVKEAVEMLLERANSAQWDD